MLDTVEEVWKPIPNYSHYQISNLGRVFSDVRNQIMATSFTPFGHMKISLHCDDGRRYDRSVAQLVALAFVEPPDFMCDHVAILDGDFTNIVATNLVLRPQWFVYRYTRQLRETQPNHYHNLPVFNRTNSADYGSIIEAGTTEGLLFEDIWRSTYTLTPIYPYDSIFEIVK